MKLKCSKCGTLIEISPEITATPQARVSCPRCHTRYRMKPRSASSVTGGRPATQPASRTAAPLATPGTLPEDSLPSGPGAPTFTAGDVVAGRYRVARFLAHGGMGEVYAAEDLELREDVALKTIRQETGDPAALDRFRREVALARKVTHPNVCRIFDLGQHAVAGASPVIFLTMELLRGETLAEHLRRRGRMAPADALPLVTQIAAALDAAHGAAIVHRDLKSDNIFLVRDGRSVRAVVTDFGIARGGADDRFAALVTTTDVVGTPAYMAPEQVEGKPVTAASDLYAFGIVLYEMMTGRLPFVGDNPITVAAKRLQEAPAPPRVHVPELDPSWERAILRCLERRPEARFSSAGAVASALAGEPQPETPPTGAGPWAESGSPGSESPTAAAPQAPPRASVAPASNAPTAAGRRSAARLEAGRTTPIGPPVRARQVASGPSRSLLVALAGVILISAALMTFNRFFKADRSRVSLRRSIAVIGFENRSGQEQHDWMSTALAEMLGTELTTGGALRTIPGDQVGRMKLELELTEDLADLPPELLRRIHGLLGCDFVVTGSFVATPPRLRVDLRLADAAVGTPLASLAGEGSDSDLFEIVRSLGRDLRAELEVGEAGTADDALAGQPRDRDAARLYSEALDLLRRSDLQAARDNLAEAARIEPENPLIRTALSSAWEALGHTQRAAEEAQRAFELSSGLPQEDRLAVEGRYRATRGDWPEAVAVYRQLWEAFPDNLEYGLQLASAQRSARLGGDALDTVARLRELPVPLSEDPRIDLAEAGAAALLGDYERQAAAAGAAAERASVTGAVLLEAQARIAEAQARRFLGDPDAAQMAAERARDLYQEVGQPVGAALALATLAGAHYGRTEFEAAISRYEEALELYRLIGDQGGTASTLNNLALVRKQQGDLERAETLYGEAEAIYSATGDELGRANALNNRAAVLVVRDELAAARQMFAESLALWEELGDLSGRAFALSNIAAVLRLEGRLAESREMSTSALAIRREIGQKATEAFSLINLGAVLVDLGELADAAAELEAGRRLAAEVGSRSALAQALFETAELRFWEGDLDGALRLHTEALALRRELEEGPRIPESLTALARLKLERGEPGAAEVDALHAISDFAAAGRRAEEGKATAILALAHLDQGLLAEARRRIADARELAEDSEQLAVRWRVNLAAARIAAASGQVRGALERLDRMALLARQAGFRGHVFESRLVQAEIARQRGAGAGLTERLRALANEAAVEGYGWILERAERAIRSSTD